MLEIILFTCIFRSTEPLEAVFKTVRKYIPEWKQDRYMNPDIEKAMSLIQNNKIWNAAKDYIIKYKELKNDTTPLSSLFE